MRGGAATLQSLPRACCGVTHIDRAFTLHAITRSAPSYLFTQVPLACYVFGSLQSLGPAPISLSHPDLLSFAEPARLSSEPSGYICKLSYKLLKEEGTVPSKSGREDKNEGAMDRAKGRMKEAGGALTGDKSTKREGRSDQRKGRAKEKKGNLKDLLS